MLIEIQGDVWLLSDVVLIALNEGDDDDDWSVTVMLRGEKEEDAHEYDMDSEALAQRTHIALIADWKKWLMP